MRKGTDKNKFLVKFHYSYYLVSLGFILTGHYLNLIIFTSLILVHEFGHYLTATLLNIKVIKIIIYPFGGKTILEDYLNRDIERELLVAVAGVIMQFFFYLVICFLHEKYLIRTYTMNLYTLYNKEIIFFNLLPIYPLDGGKILNLLLSIILPYYKANIITIILSLFTIIFIINIYKYNYSNILIFIILLYYLYLFYKKRKYLYHKFLLERYLYKINYSNIKIINNIYNMYKNKTHLININNHYKEEKEVLKKYFNK